MRELPPTTWDLTLHCRNWEHYRRSFVDSLAPLDQFDRAQWREGFEDACQALEVQARRYFKKWTKTTRIKVLRKGIPVALSNKEINKMTMGKLAETFGAIQSPNHADSIIEQALTTINKDRIGVAHHKAHKTTEKRLRTNVGQHMWTIVAALNLMA